MSDDFYRTAMGRRFFEATMPDLVRELARLNTNLERLLAHVERDAQPPTPAPTPERTS